MQEMPTGYPIRRMESDDFKLELIYPRERLANEWLSWKQTLTKQKIRHRGNAAEFRVGPKNIPVDGIVVGTRQILQFHGYV